MSDREIVCEYRTYTDTINTHQHDFLQLILPFHGVLNIETEQKNLKLSDSQLYLLPVDCNHTFWATDNNRFLVLDIPKMLLPGSFLGKYPGGKAYEMDEKWKAIRLLLANEMNQDHGVDSDVTLLLYYFQKYLIKEDLPESVAYIQKHYAQDIKLERLAQIEHYQVNYYCEWFKRTMFCTPMEYLKKVRIEHAKELLLGTNLSILQIAWEVGYSHQSSLTRAFKEIEHITPEEFRQKNMKIR
ncbi:MAG: AraC family transcriptional regulator [Dehalobacterium sp.]